MVNLSGMPDKGVVTNTDSTVASAVKRSTPRRLTFLLISIVILLVCGIAYYLRSETIQNTQEDAAKKLKDNSDTIINLQLSGKYDDAKKLAGQGESKESLITLAVIEYNQQHWQASYDYFKKAEQQYGLDVQIADNLARCAVFLNKKEEAVQYYQKEIELINAQTTNPVKESDIAYINQQIEKLR